MQLMYLFKKVKKRIKSLLLRPRKSFYQIGKHSFINTPRKLVGNQYITIGDEVVISEESWISAIDEYAGRKYSPRIDIGSNTHVGRYFCLAATGEVNIGKNCLFSEYVYISDHYHGHDPEGGPLVTQALFSKGVTSIGDGTFLGYRVSVLPGVQLGNHCIVGAHSVVTHSFPDYSMIAGSPAKLIKKYSFNSKQWEVVKDLDA